MNPLRRAAIWTVAIELPLAVVALLSSVPVLYRTVPLVLTVHIPGILLLDTLHICCGIRRPSFEPPVPVSIAILALANAAAIFVAAWFLHRILAIVRPTPRGSVPD